jgi:hypothetical protein
MYMRERFPALRDGKASVRWEEVVLNVDDEECCLSGWHDRVLLWVFVVDSRRLVF